MESEPAYFDTVPAMPTRKKTVADLADADLKGKKVLVRADLNVPLDVSFRHHIFSPPLAYLLGSPKE